jgi:hypothetical protein
MLDAIVHMVSGRAMKRGTMRLDIRLIARHAREFVLMRRVILLGAQVRSTLRSGEAALISNKRGAKISRSPTTESGICA